METRFRVRLQPASRRCASLGFPRVRPFSRPRIRARVELDFRLLRPRQRVPRKVPRVRRVGGAELCRGRLPVSRPAGAAVDDPGSGQSPEQKTPRLRYPRFIRRAQIAQQLSLKTRLDSAKPSIFVFCKAPLCGSLLGPRSQLVAAYTLLGPSAAIFMWAVR